MGKKHVLINSLDYSGIFNPGRFTCHCIKKRKVSNNVISNHIYLGGDPARRDTHTLRLYYKRKNRKENETMKVKFYNLNNNDTEHTIIFLSLTVYASGAEDINVLFDGHEYKSHVYFDCRGNRSFKRCGKSYDFEIIKDIV